MRRVAGAKPIPNTSQGVDVFLFRTPGDEFVYPLSRASIEEQIPDSIHAISSPDELKQALGSTTGEFLHLASARIVHLGYTIRAMRGGICFPKRSGHHVCFASTLRCSALDGAVIPPHKTRARAALVGGRCATWDRNTMQLTQPPLAESDVLCGVVRPVPIMYGLSIHRSLYMATGGIGQINSIHPCAGIDFILRLMSLGVHFHSTPYVAALYLEL